MNDAIYLLLLIPIIILLYFLAKNNVEMHNELKDAVKKRGMEYCLAELAIAQSTGRKAAIKSAIQELQRDKS